MRIRNYDELEEEFLLWKNAVNNINRYFNNTPLLGYLNDHKDLLIYDVLRGESFYRGRIYNFDDKISNAKEYRDWINSTDMDFQGYSAEESGAPPSKNAKEGRLNGSGISFLYTCSDVKTVVCELRPTREEIVSVAEFVTKNDVCFADLTKGKSDNIRGKKLADLIWLIAHEFAIPHYEGHNYAFTQYLAGHFMNMGFGGVIFESSLNPGGENFVFFDPKDCKAISSRLYRVDDISILSTPITRKDI